MYCYIYVMCINAFNNVHVTFFISHVHIQYMVCAIPDMVRNHSDAWQVHFTTGLHWSMPRRPQARNCWYRACMHAWDLATSCERQMGPLPSTQDTLTCRATRERRAICARARRRHGPYRESHIPYMECNMRYKNVHMHIINVHVCTLIICNIHISYIARCILYIAHFQTCTFF